MRPYRLTDKEAIDRCGTATVTLTNHLADFAAELPDFTPAYVAAWRAQIEAAQQYPTEEYNDDCAIVLLNGVKERVKEAAASVAPIRVFAQGAFQSKGHYRAFRFRELDKLRQKPSQLVTYLRALHRMALKHQAALAAKGMNPAHLAALLTAASNLASAEEEHEYFRCEMISMSHERELLFTAMWNTFQDVSRAADLVYFGNPIKRALFNVG